MTDESHRLNDEMRAALATKNQIGDEPDAPEDDDDFFAPVEDGVQEPDVHSDEDDGSEGEGEAEAEAEAPVETAAEVPDDKPAPKTPEIFTAPAIDEAAISAALEDIETRRDDLMGRFDEGEIDRAELKAQLKALDAERDTVKRDAIAAAAMQEAQDKAAERAWQAEVDRYKGEHPALFAADTIKDFDQALKFVSGNPRFADKTDRECFEIAHDILVAQMAPLGRTIEPRKGAAPKPAAPKPANPVPEKRGAVPTIGRLPSGGDGVTAGRFDQIENLMSAGKDADATKLLARMSPAERKAYGG